MSLETIKKELADLLENIDFDCQAAESKATGANIHNIKALGCILKNTRFRLLNNSLTDLSTGQPWGEKELQWVLVSMKKCLLMLNLLRLGKDYNTADRESKKLFDPGKFPTKD